MTSLKGFGHLVPKWTQKVQTELMPDWQALKEALLQPAIKQPAVGIWIAGVWGGWVKRTLTMTRWKHSWHHLDDHEGDIVALLHSAGKSGLLLENRIQ